MRHKLKLPSLLICLMGCGGTSFVHAQSLEGHSLELKARVVQFDVDVGRTDTSGDFKQSALGLQLDYKSPYFMDIVGVDLSAYEVRKLGQSAIQKNEMLPNDVADASKVVNSWSQIGQAALKLKYQDLAEAKIGRQLHNSLLLKSTNSRAVQDAFSGYSMAIKPVTGLKIYGAVYDAWLPRSGDKFQKFATEVPLNSSTGKGVLTNVIDSVAIYGFQYASGPFQVDFESLRSKNYLQKYGVVGSYLMNLQGAQSVKFSVGASTSSDAGALFSCSAEKELDKPTNNVCSNNGQGVYLDAEWKSGNLMLGAAVAKFRGLWIEDNFAVSNVSRGGSPIQDHGTNFFPTGSTSGNDMTNDGELARMVRLGYDWKEVIPGLRTVARYKLGTGARNNAVAAWATGREKEREFDVIYAVPFVKGLSARYNYLNYSGDVTPLVSGKTINAIASGGSKDYRRDHRIYVDYSYKFF